MNEHLNILVTTENTEAYELGPTATLVGADPAGVALTVVPTPAPRDSDF